MIKEFYIGERVTETHYDLIFDDGAYNGFSFPCDKNGKIKEDLNPVARKNYEYCLQHPEKFIRFNKPIRYETSWKEPNWGICECGEKVELVNSYLGACECHNCGRWYNTFGQELNPPETWSEGDDW